MMPPIQSRKVVTLAYIPGYPALAQPFPQLTIPAETKHQTKIRSLVYNGAKFGASFVQILRKVVDNFEDLFSLLIKIILE